MALYIPGTTPQDQLMTFLVRKFSLNAEDQHKVRLLMNEIEEGAVQNYVDRIKPEQKALSFAKKKEQLDGAERLQQEQEEHWRKHEYMHDQDNIDRWNS